MTDFGFWVIIALAVAVGVVAVVVAVVTLIRFHEADKALDRMLESADRMLKLMDRELECSNITAGLDLDGDYAQSSCEQELRDQQDVATISAMTTINML